MTPDKYAAINELADLQRGVARREADRSWAIDSALSLYRKASSGVYRSSETTGDGAWDPAEYERRADAAAREVIAALWPTLDPYQANALAIRLGAA